MRSPENCELTLKLANGDAFNPIRIPKTNKLSMKSFVNIYYSSSPPLADVIRDSEVLRTAVRVGLVKPLVHITRRFVG
jgi:hypothetical protein